MQDKYIWEQSAEYQSMQLYYSLQGLAYLTSPADARPEYDTETAHGVSCLFETLAQHAKSAGDTAENEGLNQALNKS